MSDIYNSASARQQQILRALGQSLDFDFNTLTNVEYQSGVPVAVSWSDSRGSFTRDAIPSLGGLINDSERDLLLRDRSLVQQQLQNLNQPVRPGSSEAQRQLSAAAAIVTSGADPVSQPRPDFDPARARLAASGLSDAAGSSTALRSALQTRFKAGSDTRVRISDPSGLIRGGILESLSATGGAVVFPYTPTVSVNFSAQYDDQSLTHSNYDYLFYQSSRIESITISGKFSARTRGEAAYVLAANHFFRTATKMFYGASSPPGLPPVVCRLSGHGEYQFSNVPVVIQSFSQEYPDDVDYIGVDERSSTRVPVLQTITVTCKPLYSRAKASAFSYNNFASGAALKEGYL